MSRSTKTALDCYASFESVDTAAVRMMAKMDKIENDILHESISRYRFNDEWSVADTVPHLFHIQVKDGLDPLKCYHVVYWDKIPLAEWKWSDSRPLEAVGWTVSYRLLYPGMQPECLTTKGRESVEAWIASEGEE